MWSDGTAPYIHFGSYSTEHPDWSNVTVSNNVYYNSGNGPSQDAKAVNNNPLFVNVAMGDFRLQGTSPAKNTGAALEIVTKDIDGIGRPQDGAWDIGAYEYYDGQPQQPAPTPSITNVIIH